MDEKTKQILDDWRFEQRCAESQTEGADIDAAAQTPEGQQILSEPSTANAVEAFQYLIQEQKRIRESAERWMKKR